MALSTAAKIDETGLDPSDPNPVLRMSFVLDTSYPTGGYASFSTFVQTLTGRGTHPIHVSGYGDGGGNSYAVEYDVANDKLKVRDGTLAEVSNATDLHLVTVVATVWSK